MCAFYFLVISNTNKYRMLTYQIYYMEGKISTRLIKKIVAIMNESIKAITYSIITYEYTTLHFRRPVVLFRVSSYPEFFIVSYSDPYTLWIYMHP